MVNDASSAQAEGQVVTDGEVESEGALLLRLIAAIRELTSEALLMEAAHAERLERVHAEHRLGARNLLHYLGVRQHDVRELQVDLAALGLSSLGRMERSVLETLARVEHASGAGEPRENWGSFARRGDRCGDERPSGMRDAEPRRARRRGGSIPPRCAESDGGSPKQEARAASEALDFRARRPRLTLAGSTAPKQAGASVALQARGPRLHRRLRPRPRPRRRLPSR